MQKILLHEKTFMVFSAQKIFLKRFSCERIFLHQKSFERFMRCSRTRTRDGIYSRVLDNKKMLFAHATDFNPWKAKAFLSSEKPKPFGFQPKVFQTKNYTISYCIGVPLSLSLVPGISPPNSTGNAAKPEPYTL